MDTSQEIFDVVDDNDQVLYQASRKTVHEDQLLHRSVHVMVFNSRKQLYLQKRALTKDENPGFWDTSAAGHVNAGEDYDSCAVRELEEELGIQASLEFLFKIPACAETFCEHVKVYSCVTSQEIVINPDEISEGRYWSGEEIKRELLLDNYAFTTTFKLLFDRLPGTLFS